MCSYLVTFPLTLVAHPQMRGGTEAEFGGKKISVDYGRPKLRGRDMLGQASEGMVWRMGTDQATTLTSDAELAFGTVTLAAGRYSWFEKRVGANSWELLVNSETGMWGTNRNPARDVATIPLKISSITPSVETFAIELEAKSSAAGRLSLAWGTTELAADFEVR